MTKFLKRELCLMSLGILVGLGLAFALMILYQSWMPLGSVPGTPVELIDRHPYIHVRTSADQLYICDYYEKACHPKDEVVETDVSLKGSCGTPLLLIGRPDGTVVASLSFRVCTIHSEDDYDLYIVALDDGRIQAARRTVWVENYPYFFGGLGGLSGLIFGFIYSGLASLFRAESPSKAKNDFKSSDL